MAEGQQFPIFITARSDPNQRAFDEFVMNAERAGKRAGDALGRAMSGVKDTISQALSIPRNELGSLDLNIEQLRQMERESQAVASATRQYAEAAKAAAIASGENYRARTEEIRAAFELARVEETTAAQLRAKVRVMEQIQTQLNQTASATDLVIGKNNELVRSMQEVARAANVAEQSQRNANALAAPGLDPFRAASNNGATTSALAEMVRQQDVADRLRAEMDNLRRAEVGAAEGASLLAAAHRGTALEIGYTSKAARESASVFEAMYREQEQAARSLDELRRAEVGAAEGAKILEATYRGTALEVGRTANSARESAAVFEKAFREQERMASGVSVEMQRLLQQIDPAAAAQMRFEQSTEMVNAALRQGIITQQQATQAMQLLNAEYVRNAGASGQMRMGMVQVGQQMQDVAISLYGGQRASVVFAQQIPQLAFALTSLEGSSNKTANRIGQIASLMSGPWSLAVVGLSAVIGGLVDKYLLADDAASKSGRAIDGLTDKLDLSKNSYEALIKVVNEYNDAQSKSTALTYDAILAAERQAKTNLEVAKSELAKLQSLYAKDAMPDDAGSNTEAMGAYNSRRQVIADLTAKITSLENDYRAANIAGSTERARVATDQRYANEVAWDSEIERWREKRRKGLVDQATYDSVELSLTKGKVAWMKRLDDAQRKTGQSGSGLFGREIGMSEARSIAASAGFQVNSGTRPTWIRDEVPGGASSQERLYNKWIAQGRPADNPTARPGTSAHESGNALDIQFGEGVTPASIKKAFADEGVRLTKILKERDHFHIEWSTKGADRAQREAESIENKAQRAAEQMQRFAESSAEKVKRINEQFDEQPRLIDQANAATRELERTMADVEDQLVNNASLTDEQRAILVQTYKDAQKGVVTIQDSLVRPLRELRKESEQRLEIERLITAGKDDEAEALQIIFNYQKNVQDMTAAQKQDVLDIVRNERLRTEELRRQQQVIGLYLDASRSVKQELVAVFSGSGSFGNFGQIFKNLQGQVIVEQLFGKAFDDFDKWVKEQSGVKSSIDYFGDEATRAGDSAKGLADALGDAAQRIRNPGAAGSAGSGLDSLIGSIGGSVNRAAIKNGLFGAAFGGAANDNGLGGIIERIAQQATGDMVVTAPRKAGDGTMGMTPERYFSELSRVVVRPALDGLDAIFGTKFFGKMTGVFSGALNGYITAGATGGILGGLQGIVGADSKAGKALGKGLGGAQTGSLVAALGNALGIGMSGTGAQIGGAIGSFIPIPGGDIIGSIIGSFIGKLFGGAKYGNASFQNGVLNVNGNNGDMKTAAGTSGNNLLNSLNEIADGLGGALGAFNVSLGQTDGKWRISTTGRTGELKSKYSDVQVFGKGDDAYRQALEAAVRDAISDGAITGISQAAQNILKAGGDLQKAIEKAALIQSIPKRLKQMTDPVGYAIDELNAEFTKIVDALKLGSASAAEFADAQKLYDLKRAEAIKQASEQMTSALRGLLNDLTTGNDALSLRERQTSAVAKYDPLRARVEAGDATAFNDFADAARALLDIERQMFGSQSGYFDRLAEVTGISRAAVAGQDALINGATGAASPFAANDNVTSSIDSQTGVLVNGFTGLESQLAAVNQNLGALIAQGYGGAQSGYSFPTPYASYY